MTRDWLIVVNLGSFAMLGAGLVFVVVWLIDRNRKSALAFAGMVAFYFASTLALSLPLELALLASVHGVLLPVAFALLADGLLRRSGRRLGWPGTVSFVVVMAIPVWFFAYQSPLLVGRMIAQNLGLGLLLIGVAGRLWSIGSRRRWDGAAMVSSAVLGGCLLLNAALAVFSDVPQDMATDAEMEAYLASGLSTAVLISTAVVLPLVIIVLLGATVAEMVADLRYQRDRDELTGLLNRRGFMELAAARLRREPVRTLILSDLDFFKDVNDALGHAGGDVALEMFAEVLKGAPDTGQVVGRIGGEEFAVLLPQGGLAEAVEWAESARARLEVRSVSYGGSTASVTASFGVAAAVPGMSLTSSWIRRTGRCIERRPTAGIGPPSRNEPAGTCSSRSGPARRGGAYDARVGILIAIEGVDGAGKQTLTRAIAHELEDRGKDVIRLGFPRYGESVHADLAAEALRGEHGDLASSVYAMATMFALDRRAALGDLQRLINRHDVVMLDRYVASNAAYSAARLHQDSAGTVVKWVQELEFERFGLPKPDLQLLVSVPLEIAQERARQREAEDSDRARDSYERDGDLQARTAAIYGQLAEEGWISPWQKVDNTSDATQHANELVNHLFQA